MNFKVFGVFLIITGCGGIGCAMSKQYRNRIRFIKNLISVIEYMVCELRYRVTVLPQLCRQAGQLHGGTLQKIMLSLSDLLDKQCSSDAYGCMQIVLEELVPVDSWYQNILLDFSRNLGRFDIDGQLTGLENTRENLTLILDSLLINSDVRLRSYQTLGLCAGAAIAILLV